MSFGWAGAGEGAAKSLEEIVAARLQRQILEREVAERQKRFQLETDRFNESTAQNKYDRERTDRIDGENRAARTKVEQTETTQRNGRSDMAAVLAMPGMTDEAKRNEIMGSGLRTGASVPDGVMEAVEGPKKKEYTYTDPRTGAKSLRYADAGEGPIDLGREPQAPQKADKPAVHNVGGKLVDSTGKVIYGGGGNGQGGPSPYAQERNARTSAAVDDIIGSVSGWTAGYGGLMANVPQSDARELRGKLNTLKANIAFNELAAMREASKTGGALGSVAVRELELLENSLGNLDQLQEPQSLVAELTKIKDSAERWRQVAGGQATPMQPVNSHGGQPAVVDPNAKAAELIKRYGGKPQ